ncbi:YkvA family protein [Streptococcus ictaluri]|uniref:DUF1232 domain-containing protein n=1 Tax=Streptococcus ictaluri 707-05 TaxID=764299 RepID=G5K3A0_9STRE|nr:DUF1232 domain-containing protein [Streptococcus ictaluri]EHI69381.1 hypothetical protein STRIC_1268 [Streptococcus ictaluri 707-05]
MIKKRKKSSRLKRRLKHLKSDLPAVYLSLRNPQTPFLAKALAFLIIGYALSPIDLIPDVIPFVGYLDDIIILPLLMMLLIKMIPDEIWESSQQKAQGMWLKGKPKRWYYALPIILFWILVIVYVIRLVWK